MKYRKSGSLKDLKELQNQYKAEPWKHEAQGRSDEGVLFLCDDRPCGVVPTATDGRERVSCLLAGVDTQGSNELKGYFPYVISAWGFGLEEESWLVQCGIARDLRELDHILWNTVYKSNDGKEHSVKACMIDAMGARTREIYAWAIAHRGRVFPWQGKRAMQQPYSTSLQEFFPDISGRKIRIPGGLNLWKCDTTFFKSDLARKLAIAPDEAGAFHLHNNFKGELDEYAKEMCVEVWDDAAMAWMNPKRRPNHYWDCEVMCLALAHILNIRLISSPDDIKPKVVKTAVKRKGYERTSIAERLGRLRR